MNFLLSYLGGNVIVQTQMPEKYRTALERQVEIFSKDVQIIETTEIPSTDSIPYSDPQQWMRIPSVICVYVDMRGSTALSAEERDKKTAAAYQLFTGTAVRTFTAFDAAYIDVRGDGAFGLFDSKFPHLALACAVTFRTFCSEVIIPKIRSATNESVGNHIAIDQRTVLVRKIGFKRRRDNIDWNNEVWAGRPVNMAAKLASRAKDDEIVVSDRYHSSLKHENALLSCECHADFFGNKSSLWDNTYLWGNKNFDFENCYVLKSQWCQKHGREYCQSLVDADQTG